MRSFAYQILKDTFSTNSLMIFHWHMPSSGKCFHVLNIKKQNPHCQNRSHSGNYQYSVLSVILQICLWLISTSFALVKQVCLNWHWIENIATPGVYIEVRSNTRNYLSQVDVRYHGFCTELDHLYCIFDVFSIDLQLSI